MVRSGCTDTPQRFIHRPNSHDSGPAFGVGDICLRSGPHVRPAAATVIVVLDTLVISFWLGQKLQSTVATTLQRVGASGGNLDRRPTLSTLSRELSRSSLSPQPIIGLVFPLFGLAVLYFLLNSWLIAFAVAFQKQQSAFLIWRHEPSLAFA